tara:strand:+ start:1700 stop:2227 length:528 start_codon:yes stop_codon:yes gene_type:complete
MEDLNTNIITKNQLQSTVELSERREEDETFFLSFLQDKIDFKIFRNSSIYDQKQVKYLLNSDKFTQKLKEILTDTKTLDKLIKSTDNKLIKYIFIKFLDTSKTDLIHIIKVPKVLSIPKYKIIFWNLLFTYEKQENFEIEFQKLIKNISESHPKKKVLEVLNFGIVLVEKMASKN